MSTITSVDAFNSIRNVIELSTMRHRSMDVSKEAVSIVPSSYSEHSVENSIPDSEVYKDYHRKTLPITSIPFSTLDSHSYTPKIEFSAYTARAFLVTQAPKAAESFFTIIV